MPQSGGKKDAIVLQNPSAVRPEASQKSNALEGEGVEPSLWALAYERLQQENVELTKDFETYLGISAANTKSNGIFSTGIEEVQRKAFEAILTVKDSHEMKKPSAKIRRCFERGIEIIIRSKSLIELAVSANPYAALAWSEVSLLLPVSFSC